MSIFDFAVGTPGFMTCVEMFIVSIIFLWSFSAEPYLQLSMELPRTRSVGGAFLEVLDARDIFEGIGYMFKIAFPCGWGRSKSAMRREVGEKIEEEKERDVERGTMEVTETSHHDNDTLEEKTESSAAVNDETYHVQTV